MLLPATLLNSIAAQLNTSLKPEDFKPVGGGSINNVFRIQTKEGKRYCCKVNSATNFPQLFEREYEGLQLLSPHIAVPRAHGCGRADNMQYLLLEWVEQRSPDAAFWESFGADLAALHSVKGSHFGAAADNYMGSVPQDNKPTDDWNTFFAQRRLLPLGIACHQKQLLPASDLHLIEQLSGRLPDIFDARPPTLLHGDLWSGNFLCGANNKAVLIDPAVYYGHPSVDLGMTTLFGGFDRAFYDAYQYHAPLPSNYREQWEVCNLYPLLIHLFLFGNAYLHPIRKTLRCFA